MLRKLTRTLAFAGVWIAAPAAFWIWALDGAILFPLALMGAALASAVILMVQDD